jgi:hypothetical protein
VLFRSLVGTKKQQDGEKVEEEFHVGGQLPRQQGAAGVGQEGSKSNEAEFMQ